jgi:hypothetical protein
MRCQLHSLRVPAEAAGGSGYGTSGRSEPGGLSGSAQQQCTPDVGVACIFYWGCVFGLGRVLLSCVCPGAGGRGGGCRVVSCGQGTMQW